MINETPSFQESLEPLSTKVANKKETIIMNIALDNKMIKLPVIGEIKATMPRIKVILATTLPIIVPRAISG